MICLTCCLVSTRAWRARGEPSDRAACTAECCRFIVMAHLDIVRELDAKWDKGMCTLPQGKRLRRLGSDLLVAGKQRHQHMPYHAAGASNYNAIPSGPLTQSPRAFRNHRSREKGLHSADECEYAIQPAANKIKTSRPRDRYPRGVCLSDRQNVIYTMAGLRAMPSKISR
jgi:hypothetical protein